MKHFTPKTLVVVFATIFALGLAPSTQADDKGCSNATLKGTFAYTATGITSGTGPLFGSFGAVGTQTFDGNGHVTGTQTVNLNGNLVLKQTFKGTYQVNPDCTGSGTLMFDVPPGLVGHSVFVIDDGGTELRGLQTDPGSVVTIVGRRQFPVGD